MAVDAGGGIYVADQFNRRVLKLTVGSPTPIVLPFTGPHLPTRVGVDASGSVYVLDEVPSEDVGAG
jgi:hypothetical protein